MGLAINGLPDLATAPVIPLGVRVSLDGAHELLLADLADAPAGTQVWLEDRVLNRRQNLAASPSYAFTMLASYTGQRFYLNFVAGSPLAVTTGQLTARTALYPNPTTATATLELAGLREQGAITVEVLNVLGQPVQQHRVRAKQGQLTDQLDLSGPAHRRLHRPHPRPGRHRGETPGEGVTRPVAASNKKPRQYLARLFLLIEHYYLNLGLKNFPSGSISKSLFFLCSTGSRNTII